MRSDVWCWCSQYNILFLLLEKIFYRYFKKCCTLFENLPNVGRSGADGVFGFHRSCSTLWTGSGTHRSWVPSTHVFQSNVQDFTPIQSLISSICHQEVLNRRDSSVSILQNNLCYQKTPKETQANILTTATLRASRSPLWIRRRFFNKNVFIREQTSLGAKVMVSDVQSCKLMVSLSMGNLRFCSSSGYFQK